MPGVVTVGSDNRAGREPPRLGPGSPRKEPPWRADSTSLVLYDPRRRSGGGRPGRLPGRLRRAHPRGLRPRPAPVLRLVHRASAAPLRRPPHRHRARPRSSKSGARHEPPSAGVCPPSPASTAAEEGLIEHSPAVHVRRPRIDYESHAVGLDGNKLGAFLLAAGLASRPRRRRAPERTPGGAPLRGAQS